MLFNFRLRGYTSGKHMRKLLRPFLPFFGPALLAYIFFVKAHISWEDDHLFLLMAFVFHLPLLIFFIVAVVVEIIAVVENKDTGRLDEK